MIRYFSNVIATMTVLNTFSCTSASLPAPISQADAVAESKAAMTAKKFAPQSHAEADRLRAEAKWLHEEGRTEEASVAGEQAIAAFNEAFTLARVARAEERLEKAEKRVGLAKKKVADLDALQARIAADADAFEMRARVHLDTEEVKDVDQISPERSRARRLAAKRLAAEADLLCLSAKLLGSKTPALAEAQEKTEVLRTELNQGSIKDDLYPRSARQRSACLAELTAKRRPAIRKAPESADSDQLLSQLSETGTLFVYRDDRGVVVHLPAPMTQDGKLTGATQSALKLLGGTAQAHPNFPLLLVTHTKKKGQLKHAEKMGSLAANALKTAGAAELLVRTSENTQPLVSPRIRGGAEKNERLEVIFVSPGR